MYDLSLIFNLSYAAMELHADAANEPSEVISERLSQAAEAVERMISLAQLGKAEAVRRVIRNQIEATIAATN